MNFYHGGAEHQDLDLLKWLRLLMKLKIQIHFGHKIMYSILLTTKCFILDMLKINTKPTNL